MLIVLCFIFVALLITKMEYEYRKSIRGTKNKRKRL